MSPYNYAYRLRLTVHLTVILSQVCNPDAKRSYKEPTLKHTFTTFALRV